MANTLPLRPATMLPPLSLDAIASNEARTLNREDSRDSRSSSSSSSPVRAEYEESDFFLGANDSQSSLGLTNIQDVQVTDDQCTPPVNRLPNEILISIFSRLTSSKDLQHCMLTCKRWARNSVDLLWHRPACTSWEKHEQICRTLAEEQPYFQYKDFIRRLNLAALADKANDGSVAPLADCNRIERLTLTGCNGLTDAGLIGLLKDSTHLLALDVSDVQEITEASIYALAENCRRLQGLNLARCTKISNESLIALAAACKYIKRLKLNECDQISDEAVTAFAQGCSNILEIDLHQCRQIGNQPISVLLSESQALRELRLVGCILLDDGAFLSLPSHISFEHMRILDLTSCTEITDRSIEKIIDAAPRIRNLVLSKCRNLTDQAVYAISRLGKNLHFLHLGHCQFITDDSVKRLVQCCNRIRYIDLGCCINLTDDSVTKLAVLPKLKRIGLVKCNNITDESVYALARANQRDRARRDMHGRIVPSHYPSQSSLERVHLSYCTLLTVKSIYRLLNACPRLTHLSLTGVQAFLRADLEQFCRNAPPEFTEHQRNVFCVFSGSGVSDLRKHLNTDPAFVDMRAEDQLETHQHLFPGGDVYAPLPPHQMQANDLGFDPGNDPGNEYEGVDDLNDDESELVVDAAPHLGQHNVGLGVAHPASNNASPLPLRPPPPPNYHDHAMAWQFPPHGGNFLSQQYQLPHLNGLASTPHQFSRQGQPFTAPFASTATLGRGGPPFSVFGQGPRHQAPASGSAGPSVSPAMSDPAASQSSSSRGTPVARYPTPGTGSNTGRPQAGGSDD